MDKYWPTGRHLEMSFLAYEIYFYRNNNLAIAYMLKTVFNISLFFHVLGYYTQQTSSKVERK